MPQEQQYDMYGDRFGKSLCHAWGASPVYLLARYFVGLEITDAAAEAVDNGVRFHTDYIQQDQMDNVEDEFRTDLTDQISIDEAVGGVIHGGSQSDMLTDVENPVVVQNEVANLLLYCVLAIVMLAAAVVLAQMKLTGMAAAAVEIVSGILRIAATVLLTLCLVTLITARVEGLGFIYFSNADVLQEVQTPANMSSAAGMIANMICLGAATVFSMIAAFFNLRKKETQN